MPEKLLYSQADVFRRLGRSIAEDCMEAGWLKARTKKPSRTKEMKIFAPEDVYRCAERIKDGEYPQP